MFWLNYFPFIEFAKNFLFNILAIDPQLMPLGCLLGDSLYKSYSVSRITSFYFQLPFKISIILGFRWIIFFFWPSFIISILLSKAFIIFYSFWEIGRGPNCLRLHNCFVGSLALPWTLKQLAGLLLSNKLSPILFLIMIPNFEGFFVKA